MTNKQNQDLTDIFDNDLSVSTREIYLCGNDGEVDEKLTMGFLKNLRILESKSKDPIIVHQYSIGGDWNAGMAMYDAIRNSPCQFVYICYGIAASMGSIIPQAVLGKGLRVTAENCEWLIHDGSSNVSGTHKQVISGINHSKLALKTMYDIYTDACNDGEFFSDKNKSQVKKHIQYQLNTKEDWIFNGRDAVWYGFADGVLGDEGYQDVLRIL
jgi:ATP-dependent protease ClpP protease subunit